MRNLKPLRLFVSILVQACERVFITTHSIDSRCVTGLKRYCLQARLCSFQPGNFTGWGIEGVNQQQTGCACQVHTFEEQHRSPPFGHSSDRVAIKALTRKPHFFSCLLFFFGGGGEGGGRRCGGREMGDLGGQQVLVHSQGIIGVAVYEEKSQLRKRRATHSPSVYYILINS